MIKKIVFDLDNTLLDLKDEYIFALKNTLNKFGYNYSEKTIQKIDKVLDDYEKYNRKLSKSILLDYINHNCNTTFSSDFVEFLIKEQAKCFEKFEGEKLDTIKYLSSKYELICITNWFTDTQRKRLENAGISKYFNKIFGGDKHELKPSLKAFDMIDNPKECIIVGDNIRYDILPALELGMQAILLTRKNVEPDSRYKMIRRLEELKEIL